MSDLISPISLALELREIINIFISVIFLVLAMLYGRYLFADRDKSLRVTGWRNMSPVSKMTLAWFIISIGEVLRSAVVWELLHFQGVRANYLTNVMPLMLSLCFVTIGGACAIRVVTPGLGWKQHTLWIGSLLTAAILSAVGVLW